MNHLLARDEREAGVDRAGDRLAYLVLSYGLLVVVAYRGFAEGQASWDLLGLVVLGGVVGAAYRLWNRALSREAAIVIGVTALVAFGLAAILVITRS
jgi:uncharacterized membrane protein